MSQEKKGWAKWKGLVIFAAVILIPLFIAFANSANEISAKTTSLQKQVEDQKAIRLQVLEKMYGPITAEIANKAETDLRSYYDGYYERLDKLNKMGDPSKITDSAKQDEYIRLRRGADNMAMYYNTIAGDKDYYWNGILPSGLPDKLTRLYGNVTQ